MNEVNLRGALGSANYEGLKTDPRFASMLKNAPDLVAPTPKEAATNAAIQNKQQDFTLKQDAATRADKAQANTEAYREAELARQNEGLSLEIGRAHV